MESITLKQTGRGERRICCSSHMPLSIFTWCGASSWFVIQPQTKPWMSETHVEQAFPLLLQLPPTGGPGGQEEQKGQPWRLRWRRRTLPRAHPAVPGPSSAMEATLILGEGSCVLRGHPGGLPAHASCITCLSRCGFLTTHRWPQPPPSLLPGARASALPAPRSGREAAGTLGSPLHFYNSLQKARNQSSHVAEANEEISSHQITRLNVSDEI